MKIFRNGRICTQKWHPFQIPMSFLNESHIPEKIDKICIKKSQVHSIYMYLSPDIQSHVDPLKQFFPGSPAFMLMK